MVSLIAADNRAKFSVLTSPGSVHDLNIMLGA